MMRYLTDDEFSSEERVRNVARMLKRSGGVMANVTHRTDDGRLLGVEVVFEDQGRVYAVQVLDSPTRPAGQEAITYVVAEVKLDE